MDVEAGASAPRGLTQRFSRKYSGVEMFIELSADQNIPSMVPGQLPRLVTPMQTLWDTVEGEPSSCAGACPWLRATVAPSLHG